MRKAHAQGVREGTDILRNVLEKKKIRASGKLIDSVDKTLFIKNTDALFQGAVYFRKPGSNYATIVEEGRPKNSKAPPYAAIREWMELKGFDNVTEFSVRRLSWKIGKKGTKARPFMETARRKIISNYTRIIDAAIKEFKRK